MRFESSDNEEDSPLSLNKLNSFELEDDFESRIPPLNKNNGMFKSESLEFSS